VKLDPLPSTRQDIVSSLDEKTTILIVDDEPSLREVAGEYFEVKGYEVLTAADGLEAMSLLESRKVDCCLSDIDMPRMDGLQLAERIRHLDASIPVVIMTGYPSLENTISTLKNGVVDFLIKPVNLNQRELSVRRVMRERDLFLRNLLLAKEVEGKHRLERINRELERKVEELHTINRIMSDFTGAGTSDEVLQRVIDLSLEITSATEARFFVFPAEGVLPFEILSTAAGNTAAAVEPAVLHLVGEASRDALPLLVAGNEGGEALPPDLASLAAVPMTIRDKVFGILTTAVRSDNGRRLDEGDLYYLSFMNQNAARAIENLALYENIYENLFSTLFAFVKAVEARDSYTQQHSNRVTEMALKISRVMGCSSEERDILRFAGPLHDIGKIGIPDNILLKPGPLTAEEFERIKAHPVIGAGIIGQLGLWEREQQIVRWHHERFDGTGYPDGLAGEEIPLLARILAVADAFDAMSSNRVYRAAMPEEKILGNIRNGAHSQFDPTVVEAFFEVYHGRQGDERQESALAGAGG
jgi:putative nucleotidyltransferase with HDIG domain